MGGVLDFSSISSLAGFKSGFIGCLSYLAIDGKVVNFGKNIIVLLHSITKIVGIKNTDLKNRKTEKQVHVLSPLIILRNFRRDKTKGSWIKVFKLQNFWILVFEEI